MIGAAVYDPQRHFETINLTHCERFVRRRSSIHGVLLVLGASCQLRLVVGQMHGQTLQSTWAARLRANEPTIVPTGKYPHASGSRADKPSAVIWVLIALRGRAVRRHEILRGAFNRRKRTLPEFCPGRAHTQYRKYYLRPATPACEIVSSCEPVPPLTPMAPMILPPTTSGLPPREAIKASPSVGR
jgi:hypothetical protein